MRTRTWAVLTTALLVPTLSTAASPAGWFLAGKDPSSYVMEQDATVVREGKTSARFASIRQPKGFGTMMQSFDPGEYLGKRVRLSAFVKTKQIKNWAGVWMRVDGPEMRMLAFDNMQSRPIKGTNDWTRHEVVLDVGDTATGIAFGIDGWRGDAVAGRREVSDRGRVGADHRGWGLEAETREPEPRALKCANSARPAATCRTTDSPPLLSRGTVRPGTRSPAAIRIASS